MATRSDAPKLLDVMTRHQIYLEGVKDQQGQQFNAVVQQLRRDLRELFFDIEHDQLSKMTKRELERFIRQLRTAQIKHFNTYTQQVLNDLRKFTETDSEVQVEIMRETQEEDKTALAALAAFLKKHKQKLLWASILAAPLPANGVTPEDMLKRFTANSVQALENTVRMAYANKLRPNDALRMILGTARLNERDGLLMRYAFQASGMTATLLQHAAGIVQAAVASQYFERYRWISVLDGRTSAICRSRHGRVYRYGEGPLPPAHPNCRSTTEPVDDEEIEVPDSYYAWLKRQPKNVQDDILGERKAGQLRSGALKSDDVPKFNDASPLTLSNFKAKLKLILAT